LRNQEKTEAWHAKRSTRSNMNKTTSERSYSWQIRSYRTRAKLTNEFSEITAAWSTITGGAKREYSAQLGYSRRVHVHAAETLSPHQQKTPRHWAGREHR
jgi:hypothetical protein